MFRNNFILTIISLMVLVSCKNNEVTQAISKNPLLSQHVWMIQTANSVGSGYDFSFSRGVTMDPFQLGMVRVKFREDGTIWGIDNIGNEVKNGAWKYYEADNRIEVSGTGIFGIDGNLNIVSLNKDSLEVNNVLKISQLDAIVDLHATLVPE